MKSHLTIDLISKVRAPITKEELEDTLGKFLQQLVGDKRVIVEIVLTTDAEMTKLNNQYRNINETTDVLSLPISVDSERGQVVPASSQPTHLGTIVISVPQANRQVGHFGNSIKEEILGLAEHGLRHLLGHDHDESGHWQS